MKRWGNEGGVGRLEKGLGLGYFLVLVKLKPLKLKPIKISGCSFL